MGSGTCCRSRTRWSFSASVHLNSALYDRVRRGIAMPRRFESIGRPVDPASR
ncbi:hypothetical protein [Streptomyces sp. NPDC052225]|uniref:hypothetical protein n=1 Tax=Streptomyces sp. NPDC052225 TaxID=3154949 RepID=UPI00343DBC0E